MIMTVAELKQFVDTGDVSDAKLEAKLQALELIIRKCTNNNFQKRTYRRTADIDSGLFVCDKSAPFAVGDTVQITESPLNEGLYVVESVDDTTFTVDENLVDESNVLVTKVEYPADVKMGVANIISWQLRNEAANSGDISKKDIQSKTLSRHSVTYASDTTESDIDSEIGVPKKHVAFLRHYKKAIF